MKVTYYKHFAPCVSVHSIVDDFGNENEIDSLAYAEFTAAKLFVTGLTFEDAGYRSIVDSHVEH